MFRKASRIALLIGSLAVYGAGATGCTDENDPKTWVAQLNDQTKQTAAVNRIVDKYENAITTDKKDRKGPTVKPLLDIFVEPMTKLCTDGQMTDQTRSKVIKFLADTWDERAVPCLQKTLSDYKPGTNEGDIQQIMRAVSNTKMKALEDGVMKVFTMMKATDPGSMQDNMYRDVQAAVLAVASPAHEDDLIKLLDHPMPDDPKKDPKGTLNEDFWQGIAATALGNIRSKKAINPLIKVILAPSKNGRVMGNNALIALVKIGKDVIEPTQALLTSSSGAADLMKYSTEENLKGSADIKDPKQLDAAKKNAEKAHVAAAAQILGALGREDAAGPLMSAITDKTDDQTKAIIAVQLPNLPKSDATVKSFKSVFENIKIDATMPNGDGAKEKLLSSVVNFYDASLVPWMLEQADDKHLKGEAPDMESVRVATLVAAISLMTNDQVDSVKKFSETKGADGKTEIGKAYAKILDSAKGVLGDCKDNADCYIGKMTDPKSQEKGGAEAALKAGYMIGIVGTPALKGKLVDSLPKIQNPGLKQAALTLLLFFSPKGDKEVADKLQAVIDKADASKDQEAIQDAAPLKQVVALLNARAQ